MESNVFDRYVTLLRQLQVLIIEGQSDSAAADGLRDRMDPLWRQLTPGQIDRIRRNDIPG